MTRNRLYRGIAFSAIAALALTACASSKADEKAEVASGSSVTIEDNNGSHTIDLPLTSVVATDNRTFETLSDWDIDLAAGAVALMHDSVSYKTNKEIVDLGLHHEPNLEAVVAVDPQLIINGQRFASHQEKIASLVPDATILTLDPREGEAFDAELKRQTTVLGEVFGKQKEAEELNAALDASIARVKAAYKPESKVLAATVSGGEIGYVAPTNGRTLGPLFDIFGFTPALEIEGSDDHQGDDISVEAIAKSNPDLILVMDRDAAFTEKEANYQPAAEVIEGSEALKNVNAVKSAQVVYMPEDTYLNEGIQTYTEFFNAIADLLEQSK
ncbi:siderophore ABC transporter substrate-binding protein [Timonella sp. A28]|uniref:siderophore ABC transporter substrate-binding protein n=1 Tax=Timonella sp. A28 TaxID=3442640 RepID=UPI003EB7D9C9